MEDLRTRIREILESDNTEDYDNSVEQIGNLFNGQLLAWLTKIKLPHGDIYNQNDMYEAYKAGEVQSHNNDYIKWLHEYTTRQELIVDPQTVPALQNKVTSLECEIFDLKSKTALRKIEGFVDRWFKILGYDINIQPEMAKQMEAEILQLTSN